MNKWGVAVVGMLACAVMSTAVGQTVHATTVPDTEQDGDTVASGVTVVENTHSNITNNGTIQTNSGNVGHNNNHARIDDNRGTVSINNSGGTVGENNGNIASNSGVVETNYSSVFCNERRVDNNGDVNNHANAHVENCGLVINNYGTVVNTANAGIEMEEVGGIANNYGTARLDGASCGEYIRNNFSGEVQGASGGGSVTIVNNFGGTVTPLGSTVSITNNFGDRTIGSGNVTISNQYYSVGLTGELTNASVEYADGFTGPNHQAWLDDYANGVSQQDWIDAYGDVTNGQEWIQWTQNGGPSTSRLGQIIIKPASGYEISNDPTTTQAQNGSTYEYTIEKQSNGNVKVTITLNNTGNITLVASNFNLVIQAIQQSSGGQVTVVVDDHDYEEDDDHHHSSKKDTVETPIDPYDLLRAQIVLAIMQGGKHTIQWSYGTSLPYDIMQLLAEHPEITIDFTYDYQGNHYEAVLNGVMADEAIPWYGPVYLHDLYGVMEQQNEQEGIDHE